MLSVNDLSFSFKKNVIFDQVSFSINDGELVGLVAPNGTGKTTLLKLLCGLLPTAATTLTLNGIHLYQHRTAYLRQLFFLENSNQLYADLTVADHLTYVRSMWHSAVDIAGVVDSLGMAGYYRKKIKTLSLGMKQHVLLAMYLVSDAQTLLIDEPLNGLDPTSIQQFERVFLALKQQGKSMLISSHQMDSVGRVSDRVFFLQNQTIVPIENTGQDMLAVYNTMYLKAGEQHARSV
ncbi:ATP-binding cassette domain-containing protein [Schleiferilactobacillus shenzhenensis]|uniref:ABC transporter domain-containing protein n=1 Tax=Schleiferilactobacillus shenzhenensis LY-73 TaxID=1231336 RepID=U4TL89_9LACO|nr:ATP-binding cassette domain-containing protein [Schleiferilactobacillus shenzhenensis]ERL64959.1 hypothetical protein L248_3121 [Schleiferilactobacillus shenzhenensis LY-73]